jgi:hypothetical protein
MSAQAAGILVLVVVMLVTGSVNTLSKVPPLNSSLKFKI